MINLKGLLGARWEGNHPPSAARLSHTRDPWLCAPRSLGVCPCREKIFQTAQWFLRLGEV